jgi:hypothetical protein
MTPAASVRPQPAASDDDLWQRHRKPHMRRNMNLYQYRLGLLLVYCTSHICPMRGLTSWLTMVQICLPFAPRCTPGPFGTFQMSSRQNSRSICGMPRAGAEAAKGASSSLSSFTLRKSTMHSSNARQGWMRPSWCLELQDIPRLVLQTYGDNRQH